MLYAWKTATVPSELRRHLIGHDAVAGAKADGRPQLVHDAAALLALQQPNEKTRQAEELEVLEGSPKLLPLGSSSI